jgi:thiosulfate/3-mercaptopyruvate sulfurtransferase
MTLSPIIEIGELLEIYKRKNVMIFDASNHSKARQNYEMEHLEGSFFIDVNTQLASIEFDIAKGGRHPLPSIEKFANVLSSFGINTDTHIVIYDDKHGANAAARFWWMLTAIGHTRVQVLNGGFDQAKVNKFPMSSKIESIIPNSKSYPYQKWLLPIVDINEVERISLMDDFIIVDVREEKRYLGEFEPIDNVAGHIPGAINIPFSENLNENGLFYNPSILKEKYTLLFGDVNPNNIVVHCGSGITACHTLLAIHYAGFDIPKLYVGSWSEWSRNNKQIIRTTN